jgi:hypothetical protein
MGDLFVESKRPQPQPRIVATYPYRDEQGRTLFEAVRYQPKDFKLRRPDGQGGWIWNLNGTRRVLYNLPAVIDAETLLICEGEKDYGTGGRLGFVATCNPGGAGKRRAEYVEWLRGKHVVIIPDRDDPGCRHARDVARSLIGVAASMKLIEPLPQSKDLTEWVESGGTREKLLRIIEKTAVLTAVDVAKWCKPGVAVPGVLASEVKPEKITWLWDNHIPFGKVTLFDGDPDEGKSLVTIDLAARLTRGWTMPDTSEAGCPPAGVVIVSLEDGVAATIRPRLEAAGADLDRVRIVSTLTSRDGIERTPTIPDDLPQIEAAIQDVSARLLILDPLVAALGAETNSYRDQDIRRTLAPVTTLADRTRVAVVSIRHLNKGGSQNAKYRGAGSIGIIAAARTAFLFADDPDEEGVHVMAPVKGNLWRARPRSLKYSINDEKGQPVIAWEGESRHTANSLLAEPDRESTEESNALADAKNFLLEILADGPVDSKKVKPEAQNAEHAEKTLFRGKNRLGVRAAKVGFGDGQHWEWSLPKMVNEDTEDGQF